MNPSIWLSLLLLGAPAFADPAQPLPGQPDPCAAFAVAQASSGRAPQKTPADGYKYVQDCARGLNWQRVETSKEMQRLLRGFGAAVAQNLPVYSCYRSQQSQDEILCRNHCAPRFGTTICEGRVAANLSEHTVGIAADVMVQTGLPPVNDKLTDQQKSLYRDTSYKMCGLLDANRKQNNGGWGGITVYGVEPKNGLAYLHMDVKKDWCNWGNCQDIPALGEGNCKRTKFHATEAKLMQELADAQKARDQASVANLTAVLKKLRADCKPGDASCRDLFKTL
jgi:hypothetical protein